MRQVFFPKEKICYWKYFFFVIRVPNLLNSKLIVSIFAYIFQDKVNNSFQSNLNIDQKVVFLPRGSESIIGDRNWEELI